MGYLYFLFFAIALLYATVGFGGGSSYIAVLLFTDMEVVNVKITALICNILVVAGSCINFYRSKLIDFSKILPLVLVSVPLSFIGGQVLLPKAEYKMFAAIILIIAAITMFYQEWKVGKVERKLNIGDMAILISSGIIGLISGVIGIGGGIFLAPLLHAARWQNVHSIAATSSLFILLNSIAGLAGNITQNINLDFKIIIPLLISVIIGGQLGNRAHIKLLSPKWIRSLTGILIMIVAIRILYLSFI